MANCSGRAKGCSEGVQCKPMLLLAWRCGRTGAGARFSPAQPTPPRSPRPLPPADPDLLRRTCWPFVLRSLSLAAVALQPESWSTIFEVSKEETCGCYLRVRVSRTRHLARIDLMLRLRMSRKRSDWMGAQFPATRVSEILDQRFDPRRNNLTRDPPFESKTGNQKVPLIAPTSDAEPLVPQIDHRRASRSASVYATQMLLHRVQGSKAAGWSKTMPFGK